MRSCRSIYTSICIPSTLPEYCRMLTNLKTDPFTAHARTAEANSPIRTIYANLTQQTYCMYLENSSAPSYSTCPTTLLLLTPLSPLPSFTFNRHRPILPFPPNPSKSSVHSKGNAPFLAPSSGESKASSETQLHPAFNTTLALITKCPHPSLETSYGALRFTI